MERWRHTTGRERTCITRAGQLHDDYAAVTQVVQSALDQTTGDDLIHDKVESIHFELRGHMAAQRRSGGVLFGNVEQG